MQVIEFNRHTIVTTSSLNRKIQFVIRFYCQWKTYISIYVLIIELFINKELYRGIAELRYMTSPELNKSEMTGAISLQLHTVFWTHKTITSPIIKCTWV